MVEPRCPSGHECQPGAKFCPECGIPIGSAPVGEILSATPSTNRRTIAVLAAVALAVALAVVLGVLISHTGGPRSAATTKPSSATKVSVTTKPSGHELRVSIYPAGSQAEGGAAYLQEENQITTGVSVTVANQTGLVIASDGDVGTVFYSGDANGNEGAVETIGSMKISVPDEAFYKITVGNFGTITFSRSELVLDGWKAGVTITG